MSEGINPFAYIHEVTVRTLPFFLDSAGKRFYEGLQEGVLLLPFCTTCGKGIYIPRLICPVCSSPLKEWREQPGPFTLVGFTTQHRGLRLIRPDVLGIVEAEGVLGRISGKIDHPYEELHLGDRLVFYPCKVGDGIVIPGFRK